MFKPVDKEAGVERFRCIEDIDRLSYLNDCVSTRIPKPIFGIPIISFETMDHSMDVRLDTCASILNQFVCSVNYAYSEPNKGL